MSPQALILFCRTPKIERGNLTGPLGAISWDDLDALFTAMVEDMLRKTNQLEATDLILYRNPSEVSDDQFLPFRKKLTLLDLPDGSFAAQCRAAADDAFRRGYARVLLLFDNHPLLSRRTLSHAFQQLQHEDECVVVCPTGDGKAVFAGMKTHHVSLFDEGPEGEDVTARPHAFLKRVCALNAQVFLLPPRDAIDNADGLSRLHAELEAMGSGAIDFPSHTVDIYRMLEKKYKVRKPAAAAAP